MSLFIGNLSSRARPDVLKHALQRVFRRFGTCIIRLKEKYGFVDYDYPASAEKALKTLQGTRICGEPINLSWQRPTTLQRFSQGGKSYEPPLRNFYPVRQNTDLRVGPTNHRDHEKGPTNPHFVARKLSSSILVDESNCNRPFDPNVCDRKNCPEDDRWGEQVANPTIRKYAENVDFDDRYKPHHHQSDRKRESDERQRISPLAGSHAIRSRSWESEKELATSRKRQKRDYESRDMNHLDGANKGPSPSLVHSDYTSSSSRSHLRSLRSFSRSPSPSKSKSVSSKKISQSSSPSKSKSGHSGTKTSSSWSRSRSKSPNSSLLPVEQDSKDYVDTAVSVDHSKDIFEEETGAKSGAGTFEPENITPAVDTESETKPSDSKDHVDTAVRVDHSKDIFEEKTVAKSGAGTFEPENITPAVDTESETKPSDSKDHVDTAVSVDHSKDIFEEETGAKSGAGTFEPENITPAVDTESETKPSESESEYKKKDLLENGHIIDDVGLHSVEEIKDSEKEDFVEEHVSGTKSDLSIRSNPSKSTRMSSEEMYVVLKHYDLQLPDKNEKDMPVETYFGSARLWPWEMVYYRRLKKGSISTENYLRRVAQNQEFGIVDRFIRSSSGWGEN